MDTTEFIGTIFGIVAFCLVISYLQALLTRKKKPKPPEKHTAPNGSVIYGTPAAGLAHAPFSAGQIKAGSEGENLTAILLDDFAKQHTNVHVFHSLKWPMSRSRADVDHAIVCGNNVLLIDSKKWKAKGIYSFDTTGNITLNDKPYRYGQDLSVFKARDQYYKYFKEKLLGWKKVTISTAVVIHNEGSTVQRNSHLYTNKIVVGDNLISLLNDFRLEAGITQDNNRLLKLMKACLKNY